MVPVTDLTPEEEVILSKIRETEQLSQLYLKVKASRRPASVTSEKIVDKNDASENDKYLIGLGLLCLFAVFYEPANAKIDGIIAGVVGTPQPTLQNNLPTESRAPSASTKKTKTTPVTSKAPAPLVGKPVKPSVGRSQKASTLFASMSSLGVLAIGAAEGNLTEDGQKTSRYDGHPDPANQKPNRGFCSDQGRSAGKSIEEADQGCLKRMQSRVGLQINLFRQNGLDPDQHLYAITNSLDLWNQASPRVSDNYPKAYAQILRQGKSPFEAAKLARIEAFRRNGQLDASGLFGICADPRNSSYQSVLSGLQPYSEAWKAACIGKDQNRRADAIAQVFKRRLE